MTTSPSVQTPAPLPYRSRKKREAQALSTAVDTPVSSVQGDSVGEQVVPDAALSPVAQRRLRDQEKGDQEVAPVVAKRGKHAKPKAGKEKWIKGVTLGVGVALLVTSGVIAAPQAMHHFSSPVSASEGVPGVAPHPVVPTAEPSAEPSVEPVSQAVPVKEKEPVQVTPALNEYGVYGTIYLPTINDKPRKLMEGTSSTLLSCDETKPCDPSWVPPIFQSPADRRTGAGHYPKTAAIGADGVTGIAGHRGLGHASALSYINALKVGDPAIIETSVGTYTYSYLGKSDPISCSWSQILNTCAYPVDILKDPVYRTTVGADGKETSQLVQKALVLSTCSLVDENNPEGDGDTSSNGKRYGLYFELVDFKKK